MSLPAPLPYEPKRFGSLREPPAKSPRPYADRLKLAEELVKETHVRPGSLADVLPTVAPILMVAGALAPLVLLIPGFGTLFFPLISATLPFSLGLSYSAAVLYSGWYGALLVVVIGVAGLIAARVAAAGATTGARAFRAVALGLIMLVTVVVLVLLGPRSTGGAAVLAAWLVVTSAAGIYGARLAARRENWLGAVGGAFALSMGPAMYIGMAALLMLAVSGKAFPGQAVARYPWRRSQVSLDPIAAAPQVEPEPEGLTDPALLRRPKPQALFLASVALVFGAFAPIVLAIPGFGVGLFGDLLRALWPFTSFLAFSAGLLNVSLASVMAGGYGALVPLLILIWFGGVTTLGGLIAARATSSRRRRFAAVGGAALLIVGGRPLLGIAALVAIAYAWDLFDKPEPEHGKEAPPAAAAQ